MRDLPIEFQQIISERGGICARTFLKFTAKNRDTNQDETLCLWTGGDAETFIIEGVSNTYYGGGCVIDLSDLENEVGTGVKTYNIKLASLTPEITMLLRVYNPKGATVSIYTALFDPHSQNALTPFVRRFKGTVDRAPIRTPKKNSKDGGTASLTLVSISRNMTRTIPSRKSNENQKQRAPNDAMFSYANVAGNIQTPWGSERIKRETSKIKNVLSFRESDR